MYTPIENETSPEQPSALPDSWINKIFDQMSASYGAKFADMWAGAKPESVKRLWAEKLAGFRTMPRAIGEALDALDSKPFPPTLPEFLTMCRESGRRQVDALAKLAHKMTDEERARAEEQAKKLIKSVMAPKRDYRAWARRLKARHESGERLSPIQVRAYEEALAEPEYVATTEAKAA